MKADVSVYVHFYLHKYIDSRVHMWRGRKLVRFPQIKYILLHVHVSSKGAVTLAKDSLNPFVFYGFCPPFPWCRMGFAHWSQPMGTHIDSKPFLKNLQYLGTVFLKSEVPKCALDY